MSCICRATSHLIDTGNWSSMNTTLATTYADTNCLVTASQSLSSPFSFLAHLKSILKCSGPFYGALIPRTRNSASSKFSKLLRYFCLSFVEREVKSVAIIFLKLLHEVNFIVLFMAILTSWLVICCLVYYTWDNGLYTGEWVRTRSKYIERKSLLEGTSDHRTTLLDQTCHPCARGTPLCMHSHG